MTWQIAFLILLLGAMAYLFLTAKLPVDLTAFLGLAILILGGYVGPTEAFSGFASPAVITMLSIFILSAALLYTGIADLVASRIYKLVGSKEIPLIITLMLVSGILSAFMNNIAATAVLMPAVAAIARRAGLSPSRLMMPLAFGSILGGTTTMVGTPPNIVAASILAERGLEPFGLFEFTPIGGLLLGGGVLFMITLGRRLLPDRLARPGGAGFLVRGGCRRVRRSSFLRSGSRGGLLSTMSPSDRPTCRGLWAFKWFPYTGRESRTLFRRRTPC